MEVDFLKALSHQYFTDKESIVFDIVIVGYGPVGAVSAILLGQYGLNVLVIEKDQEAYPLPRAIALDNEAMRILQQIGITDQLLKDFVNSSRYEFLDKDRNLLFGINRHLHDEMDHWGQTFLFRQPEFEKLLRQHVQKFSNIQVHTNETFLNLIQNENYVEIYTNKSIYKAKYAFGCDGAKSSVRKICQIPMKELEQFHQPWLVVDAILKDGAYLAEEMQQICDPYRAISYIPRAGTNERRWEFQLRPEESEQDMQKHEKIYDLMSPWISKDKIDIERTAIYTFRALEATSWRKGRVFLLGDAAHMMPPFLGQGLCSGIKDAMNISWKISRVLNESVNCSILNSYELERKQHVRSITNLAIILGKIIMLQKHVILRNRLLAFLNKLPLIKTKIRNLSIDLPKMNDKISTKSLGNKFSGERILRSEVFYRNQKVWLDDIIENHFAIIAFNYNPTQLLNNSILKKWKRFGSIFIQVTPTSIKVEDSNDVVIVEDIEGKLESFFKSKRATCLIIRPDKYILGEVYNRGNFIHKITNTLEMGH